MESMDILADTQDVSKRYDVHLAAQIVASRGDEFTSRFLEYIVHNMPVYEEFERRALRLWASGRTHYSARTILESVRHDTDIHEVASEYKINNNIIPDCARLFAIMHPDKPLFSFREARGRAHFRRPSVTPQAELPFETDDQENASRFSPGTL